MTKSDARSCNDKAPAFWSEQLEEPRPNYMIQSAAIHEREVSSVIELRANVDVAE
jgi:hypothetical protein